MKAMRRWFPHPVLSAGLLVVWLLLQSTLALAHLLLGAVIAVGVPLFTQRFWPEPVRLQATPALLRLLAHLLWDILVANFAVARITLGPASALKPAFVRVPVELEDDFALTVLAGVVSLTPGSLSAEISFDRRHVIVHALALEDEAELVKSIKQRYERPIKEIFQC